MTSYSSNNSYFYNLDTAGYNRIAIQLPPQQIDLFGHLAFSQTDTNVIEVFDIFNKGNIQSLGKIATAFSIRKIAFSEPKDLVILAGKDSVNIYKTSMDIRKSKPNPNLASAQNPKISANKLYSNARVSVRSNNLLVTLSSIKVPLLSVEVYDLSGRMIQKYVNADQKRTGFQSPCLRNQAG